MTRLLLLLAFAAAIQAAEPTVKVRSGQSTLEVPMEKYVAAVLAGESSVFRSGEALKAMAVAIRTYAVKMRGRHAAAGYDFCSTTHCQRMDLDAVTPKLLAGVESTEGELLWFQGKPAFTPYSVDCGGFSEDAEAAWPGQSMPYLRSHPDPYCQRAGTKDWQWSGDPRQIAEALRRAALRAPALLERIAITERSASGRAVALALIGGGETLRMSASTFRFALGRQLGWNSVRSDHYDIETSGARIRFAGTGAGHGVGLCQHGADQMGVEGRSYREILAFYYPGTAVGVTARGLAWQRLGGDSMTLLTTRPAQDAGVLAEAERQARAVRQRTSWPLPANLELRVYPDVESFRNATGEPGWVAAHTEGRRIHLQPASVLRQRGAFEQTLRHELLHAALEARAVPGLPLWFREGLVGWLAAGNATVASPPQDRDLRQTRDQALARKANAEAAGAVAALVKRYGEATVLSWVARGMPKPL